MQLLSEKELIWSPVVANNRMNRKRVASVVNSYERELYFNPATFLEGCSSWLDLCCGEGNALIQYAQQAPAEMRLTSTIAGGLGK